MSSNINEYQRRIIGIIVLNEDGVLSRIAGLFAGRGYDIATLTVAPMPKTQYSRITLETCGDQKVFEQIIKQIHKLIPVIRVIEVANESLIEKETVMIKIPFNHSIADIEALCRAYNGVVANVSSTHIIITATDDPRRIKYFIEMIDKYSPSEIIRGGVVAIQR